MVKEEIISRFRYDMAMLTFDPMTGEDFELSRYGEDAEELYQAIKSAIEYMENSELVVRCKDCKYWLPHTQFGFDADYEEYHDYCQLHCPDDSFYAYVKNADDFCSWAERKEE